MMVSRSIFKEKRLAMPTAIDDAAILAERSTSPPHSEEHHHV